MSHRPWKEVEEGGGDLGSGSRDCHVARSSLLARTVPSCFLPRNVNAVRNWASEDRDCHVARSSLLARTFVWEGRDCPAVWLLPRKGALRFVDAISTLSLPFHYGVTTESPPIFGKNLGVGEKVCQSIVNEMKGHK